MKLEKIKQARAISIKYNFPLVKRWKGLKAFWHVWHQSFLMWFITYEEYIDRIIAIEEQKPQGQKAKRYKLMKSVQYQFKASQVDQAWVKVDQARDKAYQAWVKVDQARDKAYQVWIKADQVWIKAYQVWIKAYQARDKAYQVWEAKNHDLIISVHKKECPGCQWDGEKLPQCQRIR
jgi:hypothetical protein